MAKPAFIYAFDNMASDAFVELCGLLLGAEFKGFLLGGVGPDGGIDGEIDEILGEWRPEKRSPLHNEIVDPGSVVVFQFKHRTISRVGQANSRTQLLNLYRSTNTQVSEVNKPLIIARNPDGYVLVTNMEVNSYFRTEFVDICRQENPEIQYYQVIGLDEIVSWISVQNELRHLYFPTIFGPPRFALKININFAGVVRIPVTPSSYAEDILQVSVLNIGEVPSYIDSIKFKVIADGEIQFATLVRLEEHPILGGMTPEPGTALEPGRKLTYPFQFQDFVGLRQFGNDIFITEVVVQDEIGNIYYEPIPDEIKNLIRPFLEDSANAP